MRLTLNTVISPAHVLLLFVVMNSSLPQYVLAEPAALLVSGADVPEGAGRAAGGPPHLPVQPAAADRGQLERRPVPGRLQSQADDARGSETAAEPCKMFSQPLNYIPQKKTKFQCCSELVSFMDFQNFFKSTYLH